MNKLLIITDSIIKRELIEELYPQHATHVIMYKHTRLYSYKLNTKLAFPIELVPQPILDNVRGKLEKEAQFYSSALILMDPDDEKIPLVHSIELWLEEIGISSSWINPTNLEANYIDDLISRHTLLLEKKRPIKTKVKEVEAIITDMYFRFSAAETTTKLLKTLNKPQLTKFSRLMSLILSIIHTLESENNKEEIWKELNISLDKNNITATLINPSVHGIRQLECNDYLKSIWKQKAGQTSKNKELVLIDPALSLTHNEPGRTKRFREEADVRTIINTFKGAGYIQCLGWGMRDEIEQKAFLNIKNIIEVDKTKGWGGIEKTTKAMLSLYNHGLITWPKTMGESISPAILDTAHEFSLQQQILLHKKEDILNMFNTNNLAILPTNFNLTGAEVANLLPDDIKSKHEHIINIYDMIHAYGILGLRKDVNKKVPFCYLLGPRLPKMEIKPESINNIYCFEVKNKKISAGPYKIGKISMIEKHMIPHRITPDLIAEILCKMDIIQPTTISWMIKEMSESPFLTINKAKTVTTTPLGKEVLNFVRNTLQYLLDIKEAKNIQQSIRSIKEGENSARYVIFNWYLSLQAGAVGNNKKATVTEEIIKIKDNNKLLF